MLVDPQSVPVIPITRFNLRGTMQIVEIWRVGQNVGVPHHAHSAAHAEEYQECETENAPSQSWVDEPDGHGLIGTMLQVPFAVQDSLLEVLFSATSSFYMETSSIPSHRL
jgi:hypothetical protein